MGRSTIKDKIMTKKDYVVVAEVLIDAINSGFVKKKHINDVIRATAFRLSRYNDKFDEKIFRDYVQNQT